MPDRVIRDELLESDRWLDLPSETDRLAFVSFLLRCDDFGNMEGALPRIYRHLREFTQVKSLEATATVLTHLCDADLIRHYKADGTDYYHIPRLRPTHLYITEKYPHSPWDEDLELGKKRRVMKKGKAKESVPSTKSSSDVTVTSQGRPLGVGVGVGVGVGENIRARGTVFDQAVDNSRKPKTQHRAKDRPQPPPALPGESSDDYRIRVMRWKAEQSRR